MEDMAPELLKTIRLAWKKALISDAEYRSLVKKIDEGKATYKEVEDLAYRVGRNLSKALKGNITSDIMPNGHVPLNVSEKILKPTLRAAHEVVTKAVMKTQTAMNKAAGIGLKAQAAEFDTEKAHGLVYKLSKGLLKDTGWILDAPVTTFVQSSADRTMEKNVKFQAKAGLHPRITRKAEGKCCKWCSKLEGSYDYGDEPQDIYKRHRNCRCVVDYRPGNGKRQNVWSKAWHEDAQPEVIEERKRRIEELSRKRENTAQSGGKISGGHHYSTSSSDTKNEKIAASYYEMFSRVDTSNEIAENTGFSVEDIQIIRRHIFFNKHELDIGYRRFYPDYDMAVAWKRLQDGTFLPRDITLLNHELLESKVEKEYNLTAREAHEIAQKSFNWDEQLMRETGGKGEANGLLQIIKK